MEMQFQRKKDQHKNFFLWKDNDKMKLLCYLYTTDFKKKKIVLSVRFKMAIFTTLYIPHNYLKLEGRIIFFGG